MPVLKYKKKITKEGPHLVCYICGMKYGTKSLKFHLKECKKKFMRKERKREKWLRIKLPKKPRELDEYYAKKTRRARK
jgi:ribosome-binding protein aMBF1 (putative translation factor)